MNNGFVKMWDNRSKRRSSVPVYDLWLDEYKNILQENKDSIDVVDIKWKVYAMAHLVMIIYKEKEI